MLSTRKFTVKRVNSTSRAVRRVILNAEVLKDAKLCAGDVIIVSNVESSEKDYAVGVVWPSFEVSQDSLLISSSLLLTACLHEGAKASVFPLSGSKLPTSLQSLRHSGDAGKICLEERNKNRSGELTSTPNALRQDEKNDWLSVLLKELLVDLKYITNSQILEVIFEGATRRFSIASIAPSESATKEGVACLTENLDHLSVSVKAVFWTATWETEVTLITNSDNHEAHRPEIETWQSTIKPQSYQSVGGLDKQIAQIRDLLEIPLTHPELFKHFGLKPPRGILLHGPPGAGKTHLARAIASSTHASVLVISGPELSSAYHGETEAKLRDVFQEAREKSPCIVVLDEVDALVPRREDGAGGEVEKRVVATLLTILDGMGDDATESGNLSRVVVVGTTNRPNAIDPALRRPGRFDREIEIGIPDAGARLSILNVLLAQTPHSVLQEDLLAIASRAHGYVGADLSAVVREAGTTAIKRWLAAPHKPSETDDPVPQPTLELSDMSSSLLLVRPSAMRSLFFETPPVYYSDIGGQHHVIQKLREAVEWPLLHPEAFARLGVRPPKGVLLYGPPGCSKTILVRACACESGVNFLAVKGPELLNKYLGESERAVREIFGKARAAAPSIIFFDEIDALASSRNSTDSDMGSHSGVLTSLLNEVDGVQELLGVTIVAATNRPEVIDTALIRPGRLDRLLYVGPPDQMGREDILRIRMKNMKVDDTVDVLEIAKLTDGCSGAEITALCQEAALLTMQKDMDAPNVPHEAFITAANSVKRQITPTVIERYERWKEGKGI